MPLREVNAKQAASSTVARQPPHRRTRTSQCTDSSSASQPWAGSTRESTRTRHCRSWQAARRRGRLRGVSRRAVATAAGGERCAGPYPGLASACPSLSPWLVSNSYATLGEWAGRVGGWIAVAWSAATNVAALRRSSWVGASG